MTGNEAGAAEGAGADTRGGGGVDSAQDPNAMVLPFYLTGEEGETARVLGRVASVGGPVSSILARHGYGDAVASLQAEALAIAACLSAFMKFDGIFTMQLKGDGHVRTLFADMTSKGALRGYAAMDDSGEPPANAMVPGRGHPNVESLMGDGYAAFTIDQGTQMGRHQAIVEITGRRLSDSVLAWFSNSEQIEAHIVAGAARDDETGQWTARAMMLQPIAAEGGKQDKQDQKKGRDPRTRRDEVWRTAGVLLGSLTSKELVDPSLNPQTLVYRLFHQLQAHVSPAEPVMDKCRCSPQKVEAMLSRLPESELLELVDENGGIEVKCEFCKKSRSIEPNLTRH